MVGQFHWSFVLQISLLDFGATREFSRKFTDEYIKVIHAASVGDRQSILDGSKNLGFLTGYETKVKNQVCADSHFGWGLDVLRWGAGYELLLPL